MTKVTTEQLEALEAEIEHTLHILLELHLEDAYSEMSKHLAKLLSSLQVANLIDYKLDVLVDPAFFCKRNTNFTQKLSGSEVKAKQTK